MVSVSSPGFSGRGSRLFLRALVGVLVRRVCLFLGLSVSFSIFFFRVGPSLFLSCDIFFGERTLLVRFVLACVWEEAMIRRLGRSGKRRRKEERERGDASFFSFYALGMKERELFSSSCCEGGVFSPSFARCDEEGIERVMAHHEEFLLSVFSPPFSSPEGEEEV